ncbi:3-hydroxyacyl-[acyl-carrier-protein] dehydratase FabZ [Candidatus Cyrtobacter comes]|uniref:3-hydroxyacyl-[acyl-carrier-protein] dehydratase FabZ n=1 Tax=Candidatus Cyrtobacter comes TaxID=675776 RepID=A0ABU5L7L8_9RICK|nr:3-hydroxyacyl-ACP dehydratase FabZ [Candidatus Cyrtobacter comes]MDZ5762119.1 3-hydroxyacyl-[acyl-carrier-protein] dehydratase FabZ [Candidatus Cyrtobacter comes]
MKGINIEEIKKIIPHRSPFLMIDRVSSITPQERISAIKCLSSNEPYLVGHFPSFAVMPGVLIIEAMAQAAAVLALYGNANPEGKIAYFISIDNAKFLKKVVPGDVLKIDIQKVGAKLGLWKFKGEVFVEQDLVCRAEFSAMMA